MTHRPSPPAGWDASRGEVALLDAASARAGDAAAVEAGDTWSGLMRRAAGHLARGVVQAAGGAYGRRCVIVVGKGDNGGDGWAAAPHLARAGMGVTVVAVHGLDVEISEAATLVRSAWLHGGGRTRSGLDSLAGLLASADVVVDCLLGTGARGALRGDVAEAVAAINACEAVVVACDVPTGVDADFGRVDDGAVVADLTVTFGAIKQGLLLHPGAAHVGRLFVGDLGPRYPISGDGWSALTARGAAARRMAVDDEKRTRGVALVVAGAAGSGGAAALAVGGAQAGGAGLVTAAVPSSVVDAVAGLVPAAMTRALPSADGALAVGAVDHLVDVAAFDVVVAGPGLRPVTGTRAVTDHLRASALRLVLDADALNVHRDDPRVLAEHAGVLVLTPHERELARLAGREVIAPGDRAEVAIALAATFDCTVVAKGPGTVVAAPDGRVWVTPVGGPALATGGTGDVLAGMVGAAIAKAADVPLAVARAVWQHAWAGQILGAVQSGRLTADDLVRTIPASLAQLGRLALHRPAWPLDGADPRQPEFL